MTIRRLPFHVIPGTTEQTHQQTIHNDKHQKNHQRYCPYHATDSLYTFAAIPCQRVLQTQMEHLPAILLCHVRTSGVQDALWCPIRPWHRNGQHDLYKTDTRFVLWRADTGSLHPIAYPSDWPPLADGHPWQSAATVLHHGTFTVRTVHPTHALVCCESLSFLVAAIFYPSHETVGKFQTLTNIHFYSQSPDKLVEMYFDR